MEKTSIGILLLFVLQVVTYVSAKGSPPSYSTDLESTLRTSLFDGYEVLQRPSEKVMVTIALNMITINYLDIKAQTLSISAYFSMKWSDTRLEWNSNSNYTNIRFLFSNEDYMWAPAVIVENSVSDISVISDTKTLMRIISLGVVNWTPGGIYKTNCEADVTYYPLDTQTCSIILSTRGYTSNEVELSFDDDEAIGLTHFTENGEWEVISTSNASTTGSRESQSFSRLYFTFTLRRRPLFHIFNTLFPVVLLASLIIFVFKLPPESGERIGMSLTVLLAYAVYLTLISDNIPQTSTSASILSTYLSIILMTSALSVILTIIVLDVYFNADDDEEVPEWLQKFTRSFLVRMACWNVTCCKRKQVSPSDNDHLYLKTITVKNNVSFGKRKDDIKPIDSKGKEKLAKDKLESESEIMKDMKVYTWKEIALLMDKCFMFVFIGLVLIASIVCLALLASAQNV